MRSDQQYEQSLKEKFRRPMSSITTTLYAKQSRVRFEAKTSQTKDSIQSEFFANSWIALSHRLGQNVAALHEPVFADTRQGVLPSWSATPIDRTSTIRDEVSVCFLHPHQSVLGIFMQFIERGVDEAIVVGDTTVRILQVFGGEVKIGISSPEIPYREVVLACHDSDGDGFDGFRSDEYETESLAFFA